MSILPKGVVTLADKCNAVCNLAYRKTLDLGLDSKTTNAIQDIVLEAVGEIANFKNDLR